MFGDASFKSYGTYVYLRVQVESKWSVSFVFKCSRVAPIKAITLPCLELLATLMCANLIVYVSKELKLAREVPKFC